MAIKPILFNTEMVLAILEGRKTQTRRLLKRKYRDDEAGFRIVTNKNDGSFAYAEYYDEYEEPTRLIEPPCRPGDILWVRERFCEPYVPGRFAYFADYDGNKGVTSPDGHLTLSANMFRWKPSIHMPKQAARIFLRVKDVRVERLQDCGNGWCVDIEKEGVRTPQNPILYVNDDKFHDALRAEMILLWDSTIKPADRDCYGWDANPWVWVIEFERCEKPKGWCV